MNKTLKFLAINLAVLSGAVLFAAPGSAFGSAIGHGNDMTAVVDSASEIEVSMVGTWIYEKGDAGASYRITLDLRADGSYTKTLQTNIGAGGTHSGTWTAQGSVVRLSGDGNWPPYSHDLATFRKIN